MKRIIIAAVIICSIIKVSGQQVPVYTQTSDNPYSINPAVAGCLPYNPIILTVRQMWTGIDDAPLLYSLGANAAATPNVGIGLKAFNYKAGPLSRSGFEGTYSYHLKLAGEGEDVKRLSFGLSAFVYQHYLDKSKLNMEDPNDAALANSSSKLIIPDAAFGIYFHAKNYFVGASAYQLFNRKVGFSNVPVEQKQVRHYNFHAGYSFDISKSFYVDAAGYAKFIEAGIFQFDVSAKLVVKNVAWIGGNYRFKDAVGICAGVGVGSFAIGYAFDLPLSSIKTSSYGSHELMIIYTLPPISGQRKTFLKGGEASSASFKL